MKIKISVKRKHIKQGGGCVDNCPIALAIKDAGFEYPFVNANRIAFKSKDGTKYVIRPVSLVAREFINQFDCGFTRVKPHTFTFVV